MCVCVCAAPFMFICLLALAVNDPVVHDTCFYGFGKFTNGTSTRRWQNLRTSAAAANVPLIELHAKHGNNVNVSCLPNSHRSYRGLWESMLSIWRRALGRCSGNWIVTFENDATIPADFWSHFMRISNRYKLVWLDSRNGFHGGGSGCCTVGMAYHRSVLKRLIYHFDPHQQGALHHMYKGVCLTDWYLSAVANYLRLRQQTSGFVRHPPTNREKDSR